MERRRPDNPKEQTLQEQTQGVAQRRREKHRKDRPQRVQQRGQKVRPLPEPDESISNFQIFHSMISPLQPGKMLVLGTGAGTISLIAARLGQG